MYDLDGFLTEKIQGSDTTLYSYSSRGELLSVDLPDGRVIEYVHDPLGRRIAKKVDGVTVEKYLWEGLTRLLAVYDGSGALLMRFEYALGRTPISMVSAGATYYFGYDQVGSLRAVSNASGTLVKKVDYDSFGNIVGDTAPTFKVPFGFAGGLHDRDTGLVRFGYRDYDPDVGRWTAKDPIGFEGGDTDLYGYCLNDPVNWVDPFGLWTFKEGVTDEGLAQAIETIEEKVDAAFQDKAGRDAVVTSTTDDNPKDPHRSDSRHFSGNAVDLRARDLTDAVRKDVARRLRNALGKGYDVVDEGDIIHIEYDPRDRPCQ
jgi:RHS repeat-associated protein